MFRMKVKPNSALVRTGWGGLQVVTRRDATLLCLPWVHKCRNVPLVSKTMHLEINGNDYATTQDRISIICEATITLQSLQDKASIRRQISSGRGDKEADRITDGILRQHCTAFIKRVIATHNYNDLSESLSIDTPEILGKLNQRLERQGFALDRMDVENINLFNTDAISDTDVAHYHTKLLQQQLHQEKRINSWNKELNGSTMQLQKDSADIIDKIATETSRIKEASDKNTLETRQQLDTETQKILSMSETTLSKAISDQDQLDQSSRQGIDNALQESTNASRSEWEQRAEVNKSGNDHKETRLRGDKEAKLKLERQTESTKMQELNERQKSDLAESSKQARQKQSAIQQREHAELSNIEAREKTDLAHLNRDIASSEQEGLKAANQPTPRSPSEQAGNQ